MYERFYSPNLMALASSQVGEDSLSVSCPYRYRRATFPVVNPFLKLKKGHLPAHVSGRQNCVFIFCTHPIVLTKLF